MGMPTRTGVPRKTDRLDVVEKALRRLIDQLDAVHRALLKNPKVTQVVLLYNDEVNLVMDEIIRPALPPTDVVRAVFEKYARTQWTTFDQQIKGLRELLGNLGGQFSGREWVKLKSELLERLVQFESEQMSKPIVQLINEIVDVFAAELRTVKGKPSFSATRDIVRKGREEMRKRLEVYPIMASLVKKVDAQLEAMEVVLASPYVETVIETVFSCLKEMFSPLVQTEALSVREAEKLKEKIDAVQALKTAV